ncbi:AraC family transcriptional regulator [Pseudomonas fluorescens]|uniref:AraC family transcriptional regulator n=1 Tax=Pseudomonas fluorescens TaxID=294 RepID=UPI0005FAE05F|nr:AraC family transcriptional regulator [Pseudomonas fluorescens]KJZ35764.1 AraC family transcriptional regulator [Pseudomonas fluorescens]
MSNLIRSASLASYESIARAVGLDPFRMLRQAKLPLRVLDDPNLLVSSDSVCWLLEESARLSGQEAFGLLMAERRDLADLGMLALMMREEPTLRAAMESSVRYMQLHNAGVQLRLEDAGDLVLLHVDIKLKYPGLLRQAVEMSTGIIVRSYRALAHDAFKPVTICFSHDRPARLDVHRRVLGTTIDFAQEFNAVVCRARDVDLPIVAATPKFNREVKRWLDMQMVDLGDQPLDRARQVIRILLPTGTCSVERVAQHLGMHRRTLNRRLAEVGESVLSVINAVRVELAEEYLMTSKRKLYEIADLVGFSSGADFSRWFRCQFGMSPSEWAMQHREQAAAGASHITPPPPGKH